MSLNLPMQIVNTGSYSEILINYFLIIFRNTFTANFSVPLLRHKPKYFVIIGILADDS